MCILCVDAVICYATRPAMAMIVDAEKKGLITPGKVTARITTVTGIALLVFLITQVS